MSDSAVAPAANPIRAHLALILAQLCFGLFPVFGKWAFAGFHPRIVAVCRIGFGALLLTLLALHQHGRQALPRRRDLLQLAICSLFGIVLNQTLFLEGRSI